MGDFGMSKVFRTQPVRVAHRVPRAIAALGIAITAVSGWGAAASGAIVYRENFTNATGAPQHISYSGWQANRGADAEAVPQTGEIYPQLSQGTADTPEPSVNSNPTDPDANTGFIYSWGGATDVRYSPYLIWTNEYSIDRSAYTDLTFSTKTNVGGNTTLADAMRMAVRIGDDWFVSDPAVQPTATTWANSGTTGLASGSLSGQWRTLEFTPGSPFVMGDFAPLPATGNIDAFGIFADSKSVNVRFGSYQVEGTPVPEPASAGIVAVAVSALALRRSRRRA